jgi:hypothetical protein
MLLKSLPHVRAWWEGYWERYTMNESMPFGREPTWEAFVDSLKEEFYPIRNYDDQYMRWMTLCQKRDQMVSEYTNIFHTLCSKLGIKDSEWHLVLKYHSGLHIGTSKHRWISWTSPHWELLIDMQSKLRRNSSSGVSGSLGLKICHNRSMEKETLTHRMKDKARKSTSRKPVHATKEG